MKQALFHDIRYAESARMHWQVDVPAHHDLADVIHPSYLWARYNDYEPGHRIDIFDPRGRFYVELLVIKVDPDTKSVLTRTLRKFDWSGQEMERADISTATVEWAGPSVRFRVRLDKEILQQNFETKEEAQAWIDERAAKKQPAEAAA